ncbi:MAG: isoaspartyl peptidase/L-asparaginase [Thermoplasmata archaeon]
MTKAIITHGGAGAGKEYTDGTKKAAEKGMEILKKGGNALDAVVEAIVVLEDDERFNAGTGSYAKLNGEIEMDAALMDSNMQAGGVAAIKRVRNPIRVAKCVMETPHVLLVGEGALDFARKMGFPDYDPMTEKARKKLLEVKEKLRSGDLPPWAEKWKKFAYPGLSGTVGAVAMDDANYFAAGSSTGGTSIMLPGRVGDSPLIGSGLYAGKHGAVTTTGIGEEIIKRVLCKSVYDKISRGMHPQKACEWGVSLFPNEISVGIIAVSKKGTGVASNREMAHWLIVEE